MNHASLFSGIGGFDLAAQWMGWNNIFHCEYNSFCQKILKYYWPDAISYGNIYETDFTIHSGTIDILTGGFPCQPFSTAGKRKGTDDDRHLWPQMLRAIREIKPAWIVGENVPGILTIENGVVFESVCVDLENEGYEVQSYMVPACATNADHRRDRIWIVAHYDQINSDWQQSETIWRKEQKQKRRFVWNNSESSFNSVASNFWSQRQSRSGKHRGSGDSKENEVREVNRTINGDQFKEPWLEAATRLCIVDDGLSGRLDGITVPKWRKESLMAAGNAIVPQVAFEIFKAIQSTTK